MTMQDMAEAMGDHLDEYFDEVEDEADEYYEPESLFLDLGRL